LIEVTWRFNVWPCQSADFRVCFVSSATEEGLPRVQVDLLAQVVCHSKRDSIGARFMIDRLGIAWYTLRYGLNADTMARWSPMGWTGSLRAGRRGGMMFSTQLANKTIHKILTYRRSRKH
jgi:hypothetical protein